MGHIGRQVAMSAPGHIWIGACTATVQCNGEDRCINTTIIVPDYQEGVNDIAVETERQNLEGSRET